LLKSWSVKFYRRKYWSPKAKIQATSGRGESNPVLDCPLLVLDFKERRLEATIQYKIRMNKRILDSKETKVCDTNQLFGRRGRTPDVGLNFPGLPS
jgi:hypothetical protein